MYSLVALSQEVFNKLKDLPKRELAELYQLRLAWVKGEVTDEECQDKFVDLGLKPSLWKYHGVVISTATNRATNPYILYQVSQA